MLSFMFAKRSNSGLSVLSASGYNVIGLRCQSDNKDKLYKLSSLYLRKQKSLPQSL